MNRLHQLSVALDHLIAFDDKPKVRYRIVKPYLAGTQYGDTKIGKSIAVAVNQKKISPFVEESHLNPGISDHPKITRTSLIQPDKRGSEWLSDSQGPIRKAKGTDLVHPTETYAKAKTKGLITKHQRSLQEAMGNASGEEGRSQAVKKFVKSQKLLSGEGAPFRDRAAVREVHRAEIGNIRSHIAQSALEGRALVQVRNKSAGSKLQTHEVPEFLKKSRTDLNAMVESHVATSHAARKAMMAGIEGDVSKAVLARHAAHAASGEGVMPDEAHVAKVVRNHIGVLEQPSVHSIDTKKHYGDLSDLLGKSHDEIKGIHTKLADLSAEGSEGAKALKRQEFIRSGKIFDPDAVGSAYKHVEDSVKSKVRTDLKRFPLLRKAGIGAGIAAAAGAGIYAATHRKKKEQRMSALGRIITFGKKIPKLNQLAEELLRKSNLRHAADRPANPLKKLSDIPRELIQHPPWEKVESHAIQNTDIISSQVAKRKREALGQIVETHTPEGLKAIQSSALKERGNVGDLIKAGRAIRAAKTGIGKGRGAMTQRALGGYIGRDPSLLQPRQKRLFNVDIAAANRDTKTYNEHRKWMAQKGEPIGTINQRRKMLAGKIKGWKTQAKASDLITSHTQGLREELTKTKNVVAEQSGQLDQIRTAGQDFPHRIERARQEAYASADSEAIRNLKGAKQHWESVIGAKESEHQAATKELKGKIRKRVAIGTGVGATAGGAAGYEAGKERKKKPIRMKSKIDTIALEVIRKKKPEASVTAHAITGGIEGALGIYATDPILELVRGGRKAVKNPFREGFRANAGKISTGAIIGAAVTAPIGWAVERVRKKRRENKPIMQFSTPLPANRTAVTRDRYGKKIHVDDMANAENNYARSAIGGGAISALLKKKTGLALRPALLTGAGAGLLTQAIVRHGTGKTRDQFGDRTYAAKRIDKATGQTALIGTGLIAGHQLIGGTAPLRRGLNRAGRGIVKAARFAGITRLSGSGLIIQFETPEEIQKRLNRENRKGAIAAERFATYAKRGGRLARDVKATIKGEKVLDARGREKTKEWDRPWVRNAATAAIVGATGLGIAGVRRVAGSTATSSEVNKLFRHIQSGRAAKAARVAAEVHIPGASKIFDKFRGVKSQGANEIASAAEKSNVVRGVNKKIDRYSSMDRPKPKFVDTRAKGGGVTRHYEGTEGYSKHMQRTMSDTEKAAQAHEKQAVTGIERATQGKPPLSLTDWFKKKKRTDLSSRLRPIMFTAADPGQYDDAWEDWLRSRPGIAKRNRRAKTVLEKEENKKVVNRAKVGGALVLGTAIGATFSRPSERAIAAGVKITRNVVKRFASRIDAILFEGKPLSKAETKRRGSEKGSNRSRSLDAIASGVAGAGIGGGIGAASVGVKPESLTKIDIFKNFRPSRFDDGVEYGSTLGVSHEGDRRQKIGGEQWKDIDSTSGSFQQGKAAEGELIARKSLQSKFRIAKKRVGRGLIGAGIGAAALAAPMILKRPYPPGAGRESAGSKSGAKIGSFTGLVGSGLGTLLKTGNSNSALAAGIGGMVAGTFVGRRVGGAIGARTKRRSGRGVAPSSSISALSAKLDHILAG